MMDTDSFDKIEILRPNTIDNKKISCILGVLKTEEGLKIQEEMYEWLKDEYNVYIVRQDVPGTLFEYPAIKFALNLCIDNNLDYVLYLHTKGAINTRKTTIGTRILWRQEFIDNINWYKTQCKTAKAVVACPFTNMKGTTWMNGFFINNEACKNCTLKKETKNRYYYEHIFNENNNITVIGRISNNIDEPPLSTTHVEMNNYLIELVEKTANNDKINKNVIYTCITGEYEKITDPSVIVHGFDYICFTDAKNPQSSVWKFKPIPEDLKHLSAVKQQRCIKVCPHKYLQNYELSIWIDGCVDITGNINEFINKNCSEQDKSVFIPAHPVRNCIYDEMMTCAKIKKDTIEHMQPQIDRYKQEGFPTHFGLVQSNIVIRRHNDKYCKNLMELWENEIVNNSHRDQLSFNYCLWKLGDKGFKYLDKKTCNSNYFKWYSRHNKQTKDIKTTKDKDFVINTKNNVFKSDKLNNYVTPKRKVYATRESVLRKRASLTGFF